MTAPELKPCPFCGADARYHKNHTTERRNSVWCWSCDYGMFDPDEQGSAIAAWNRRADLATVPAQVRVKPLVWTQIGSSYRAPAPLFGHIRVEDYALGKWSVLWSAPGICDTFTDGAFYTPEAAKAAAQADYEARILAAIETTPDPRDEVIAALVSALGREKSLAWIIANSTQESVRDVARFVMDEQRAALAAAKAVQHGEIAMTKTQRDLAHHALGLPHKRKVSYRNYFVTGKGSRDYDHWVAMVEMGAAQQRKGNALSGGDDVFRLTRAGAEYALNDGEKLSAEDFPQIGGTHD